ncbi:MAG: hypothetical protein HUK14_04400 [Muribaculaceae bacterium]|nr:hypothetical protein [Muribaculaceae bacterium]
MATEKAKVEQVASVEERLKNLYTLQTILSDIDRIKIVRGELPLEVRDLEDSIQGLHTRIDNYRHEIEELRLSTITDKERMEHAKSEIEKYKNQLNNITNNHEFDNLSKEIENQGLDIEIFKKRIRNHEEAINAKQEEIYATEAALNDKEHILRDKKSELDEIVNETRSDEERLREKAKEIEPLIDQRTLTAFKRIRKNARNGLGIVYIQRNACGGCFNRIPPQKQMEIKMHKKIIVCEYCGRIMIDPALAGVDVAEDNAKA